MDTEEQLEIKRAQRDGRPETDEGPFYHDAWWESYKGGVKGKLGGLVIGTALGMAVGALAAAVIGTVGGVALGTGGVAAIIGGFAAGGLLYGSHEFSEVGKVTGAVAAAHEKAEHRMKAFEAGKFAEIKQEIGELKALVAGKPQDAKTVADNRAVIEAAKLESNLENRSTHCDEHCPPEGRKWIFGKVAGIGLLIGAAAGALLGISGAAEHALSALSGGAAPLSEAGIFAASVTTLGLLGASFGVNRDVFRKVFDKTDLWFRGLTRRSPQMAVEPEPIKSAGITVPEAPKVATAVGFSSPIEYPQSQTFHRDRVLAAAEKALLSFDHTRATPQ